MSPDASLAAMPQDLITSLVHHPYEPPAGFGAVMPGVHKASTVTFPNVAAMRARNWKSKQGYTYGLHGTPTSFTPYTSARIADDSAMLPAQTRPPIVAARYSSKCVPTATSAKKPSPRTP